jgi:MarR family transcriptional regulator, organic hydroperoxide resistance regulator
MSEQLMSFAEEIINAVRVLQKEVKTYAIKKTCSSGFTVPQMMLIHVLHNNPGITLNELSKRLSLSKSTVSGIVDRLEKGGHVIREIPEDNRRVVKISLVESDAAQAKISNVITEYVANVLGKMSAQDAESIVASLRKLQKAVEDYEETEENQHIGK